MGAVETQSKTQLTEEELNLTLKFAEGLFNGLNGCSPFIQNQNLIDLMKYNCVDKPTLEKITDALKDAVNHSDELRGYSEFLSTFDSIYSKTLDYLANILSFDLSISCKNMDSPSNYKSKEYLADKKRVHKFLDSFDYKSEFKKIVKQIVQTGVSFNSFRDSYSTYNEDKDALEIKKARTFALQTLPQKYCLITGYCDKGEPLFDFDMTYFTKNGVDINLFDPWFKERFALLFDGNNTYVPSAPLNKRNGQYSNYVQTSPIDGFYCFKWDLSTFNIVPPLASLMKSAINNDAIANLQTDKDMISAYLLLAGEIGMLDSTKATEKNQTKFSPKTLGELMNLVTSGLKRNVKAVAMPVENIRGWQYNDQNPNMANNQYRTTASQGASASSLIYTTEAMSQSVLQNAIIADYNMMKALYSQFEHFLEFFINRKTKKYKFSFRFDGSNYPFEREFRRQSMNELASLGLTLNASAWASVYGYEPQIFERMLEEGHNGILSDNLTMLLNKNTMTDMGGAPTKSSNQLSDAGEQSREG